ncbi:MAG: E3 ubiquitin protein ligase [Candidatus Heimdallarchaeota archaeon]
MTNLKGQNIDFSTRIINPKKRNSSSGNKKDYKNISGDFVEFKASVIKKDKLDKISQLQGTNVIFSIAKISKWSWEEKKPAVCMICKLALKSGQNVARCPMCHSLFHNEHVFEWLKIKGKCPVCLQSLHPGGTEEVKL